MTRSCTTACDVAISVFLQGKPVTDLPAFFERCAGTCGAYSPPHRSRRVRGEKQLNLLFDN